MIFGTRVIGVRDLYVLLDGANRVNVQAVSSILLMHRPRPRYYAVASPGAVSVFRASCFP